MNRRYFLAALGCSVLPGAAFPADASESIEVTRASLEALADDDDRSRLKLLLTADIALSLTETLRDAVNRGLALYFQTELQVLRPRWYWMDAEIVKAAIEWRLSYHALTRQYRVASNAQGQAFNTLQEAVAAMSTIRATPIATTAELAPGQRYEAWLRMRLDTGRLPKPFQMTALTNRDWNPQSEWKRFDFTVPTRPSAP